MADENEVPTRPATPNALEAYRTKSGQYRMPADVAEYLIDARFHALEERIAELRAEVAALTALVKAPREAARALARLEEVCLDGGDPRVER
jgi:hypothetical protein